MGRKREFRVLVATDGSHQAKAAIATAVHFPWPARTRVRAVVARTGGPKRTRSLLLTVLDRGAEMAAESARRALSRRWPDVEVVFVEKAPVEGILAAADRLWGGCDRAWLAGSWADSALRHGQYFSWGRTWCKLRSSCRQEVATCTKDRRGA